MFFPHLIQVSTENKGFTLIELLLVVAIIAIVTTAGFTTYFQATQAAEFEAQYDLVLSSMRSVRLSALTNEAVDNQNPERFGIYITESELITFADDGATGFRYDSGMIEGELNEAVADTRLRELDFIDTNYQLTVFDSSKDTALGLPVLAVYQAGTGKLWLKQTPEGEDDMVDVSKRQHPFIALRFADTAKNEERFATIFQISGLVEEYDSLEEL